MLSIIIPVLNEEKYLPLLLDSIKNQTYKEDYEIIVADAGSQDKTVGMAKEYGCQVVKGGLPARGRNEGAKVAKGDILVFADADIVLPLDFFEKALAEFKERKLGIASVLFSLSEKNHQLRMDIFYNLPIRLLEKILPHAAMLIMVKKEVFELVGGFDETIRLAEDMHFARQAAKHVKFGLFRSVRVLTSPRRYLKDGAIVLYLKFLLVDFHMVFLGPVRSDIFHYRFDHYHK